jgi:predicted AAA+ superfamily ATPase
MRRLIENDLLKWKNNADKKPLIVFGARQIGKTYTIVKFGKEHYNHIVTLNFELNTKLRDIFEENLDPYAVVKKIEQFFSINIDHDTLLFFDEIQACPRALTSLKYFCENAQREFNVIAAGSLLGIAVEREHYSFPVGKVDRLNMFPLNFEEFLLALEQDYLIDNIKECFNNNTPLLAHQKAIDYFEDYLAVGGMPEVVDDFIKNNHDYDYTRMRQLSILGDYETDMIKYATKTDSVKIRAIYRSIYSQLAKENRKFQYALLGSTARASQYEFGVHWLLMAGLLYQCNKVNHGTMPLLSSVELNSYKAYASDVGLLCAQEGLPQVSLHAATFDSAAKGALAENYVACQLMSNGINRLFYWESGGSAEVDFVVQLGQDIVPIETKANLSTKSKSLNIFVNKYKPNYAIRISAKNFGFENNIKSVPLYAVFCIK